MSWYVYINGVRGAQTKKEIQTAIANGTEVVLVDQAFIGNRGSNVVGTVDGTFPYEGPPNKPHKYWGTIEVKNGNVKIK